MIMEARGAEAVVSLAQLMDEECQVRSCHHHLTFHLQTTWLRLKPKTIGVCIVLPGTPG